MQQTLEVDLGERSYPIHIGPDLLEQSDLLSKHLRSSQVMVVTNVNVGPLYLDTVTRKLREFKLETLVLPDGEQTKNLETVEIIFDALMQHRFSRNSTLVALGGGVIGDIVGFAAACFQRGIHFIQIPTTLLAQVDSSVGGKTGVNHPRGKNMIGAFYQPDCVIIDTSVLRTLENRELSAGLAEVVKYGLIRDPEFFEWLEANIELLIQRNHDALAFAIKRSCANKARVVSEDERESGLRAILNLGHTFGHAIETGIGYGRYLHGEAVAIGICQAAHLSHRLGWLTRDDVDRIIDLLQRAKLPVNPPLEMTAERFLEIMSVDKKNVDGKIRLILLRGIGKAALPCTVDRVQLETTLNEYGRN
ncbi:MAG: 3-dehydroquinate synthase [Methylococcaceae bacterium]|nr:3-dehydroquinate synthase [Methylococcaceae bacterium]MCI0732383.1 3-dehydroquinate synthase [Methylococcaceae bacterium]